MITTEPTPTTAPQTGAVKKYSAPLRLWHWLNTIVISGSLLTVLLNSTLTNGRKVQAMVQDKLQKGGLSVTKDQARAVSHTLSDSVWDIHIYFGYCLAGLLLFRLALEFFQVADQKFIRALRAMYRQFKTTRQNRQRLGNDLVIKIIYAVFYILLITMVVTGLCLAFEDVPLFKQYRHPIKEVHNFGMYLVLAFIAAHLAGVFLAERKDRRGIVSDMINGGNPNE